jgi:hypothetical protein
MVIDPDLGHSRASVADRTGVQRLVAAVGLGKVGLVLGLEVSRQPSSHRRRNLGHEPFGKALIKGKEGRESMTCARDFCRVEFDRQNVEVIGVNDKRVES